MRPYMDLSEGWGVGTILLKRHTFAVGNNDRTVLFYFCDRCIEVANMLAQSFSRRRELLTGNSEEQ